MEFEYDLQKSISNKIKHGIDFEEAKHLREDRNRIGIQARSDTELRFALIAAYREKLWTAFYTMRNDYILPINFTKSVRFLPI